MNKLPAACCDFGESSVKFFKLDRHMAKLQI